MSKQCLNISQMQHLKELGVDISKASMCWWRRVRDFRGEKVEGQWNLSFNKPYIVQNFEKSEDVPSFTLQDILDLLPKEILRTKCSWSALLYIDYENDRIFYGNICRDEFDIYYEVPICENIIDSAYEMLCWCIEKGYIETHKTK